VLWVEGLGQSFLDGMLSQSHELSVAFKGIRSVDNELTYVFFGNVTEWRPS